MTAQAMPAGPSSQRPTPTTSALSELSAPLRISSSTRSYGHQYANIYFIRLVQLRDEVMQRAEARWAHVQGSAEGEQANIRQACVTTPHSESSEKPAVLYRRNGVYGDATQAERAGGAREGCESVWFFSLTHDSNGFLHLRHDPSSSQLRTRFISKTSPAVSVWSANACEWRGIAREADL